MNGELLTTSKPVQGSTRSVHRFEVWWREPDADPTARSILDHARRIGAGVSAVRTARVTLIEAELAEAAVTRIASQLLTDPVSQEATVGIGDAAPQAVSVEIHCKPGVMDPVAQSTRDAVAAMVCDLPADRIEVRTGLRVDLVGADAQTARRIAAEALANTVIHDIHDGPYTPAQFPRGSRYDYALVHVPMCDLDDDALTRLSRKGHLFLSLEEMRAVQDYFRDSGREPTDVELETIAQTWSEHCVHKTLKSRIRYEQADTDVSPSPRDWTDRPNHTIDPDGSLRIDNLLASTIAAATRRLMADEQLGDFCVSVFEDNAGIVRFDDDDGVCIKVETHNHPSALEPYGGASTGVGGCIRDVIGTGLAARPIADTDVFCVAWDGKTAEAPPTGVLPPRRVLEQVVAGVRDYGNRMGIPTVNGAVWFHDDYIANPLVFCGCVGVIPLSKCFGDAQAGDHIIALGGRTGRDGIHGATFSSAELTDTHGDEFSHAVQIGNAITEKAVLDVILQARDHDDGCLFHAITDCGAGGFSSAVGEMAEKVGARVVLDAAPLKYEGLSYTEIWISEAQERMVLAVRPRHVEELHRLCAAEDVESADLGRFGFEDGDGRPLLVLTYHGHEVARLSMALLHEGVPTPIRQAKWDAAAPVPPSAGAGPHRPHCPQKSIDDLDTSLRALLAHPNIASKHWIVRQYDHEVQGATVVKPMVGPHQDGPGDAAVVRPKLNSRRGVAIGCGLQPGLSEKATGQCAAQGDSYWATLAAIDEAVRNVVCVGAQTTRIALLDNFCWPGCEDPAHLGSLVRAAEACYDGAMAYRAPFVSGKDSLSNQFTAEDGRLITIPPTLLITALGIVPDVKRCRTMNAKAAGNLLLIVGRTTPSLGGSHYVDSAIDSAVDSAVDSAGANVAGVAANHNAPCDLSIPRLDLATAPRNAAAVARLIADGLVESVHDCSDGGLLVAAAEMAFAGRVGLELNLADLPVAGEPDLIARSFAETPGRYLLEVTRDRFDATAVLLKQDEIAFAPIGKFADHDRLIMRHSALDSSLDELRTIWQAPLDW